MKRIYFYVLTLLVCFACACTSSDFNQDSEKISSKELKTQADQRTLTSLYTNLMGVLETSVSRANGVESELPPYFGGAYIENGKLLVYLVSGANSVSARETLASKIDTTNIVFKNCDNSYQSLLDLTERLRKFFYEEGNRELIDVLHIDGWGPNKKENKVLIKLQNCTPQYIEDFKNKVMDSPLIGFTKSRGRINVQATGYIIGRSQVTNHRGSLASIGYRVNSSSWGHGFWCQDILQMLLIILSKLVL